MKSATVLLLWAAVLGRWAEAQGTWPSAIDELEDVMFLNTGYRSRGFAAPITPCAFSSFGPGRQTAAEFLRVGFHDMATANVFNPPYGGIDASLAYELNSGENLGSGLASTFVIYGQFYNSRLPVSDLVALGVYASVRSCGGPIIPMRGGRKDAGQAGPQGTPQPQNAQPTFINQFARMGFGIKDMISMTACGHTMGGVHAGNFPEIVPPGSAPNNFVLFDTTPEFDNNIATRYINGPTTDPLSVGPSVASRRNADTVVFTADRNVTLQQMTNAATFNSLCSDILQRMIEVVDPAIVTLSPIIQPYEVKPAGLQLTLLSGGTQLTFSGNIRVRTTVRPASQISSVQIVYQNRNGVAGGSISTVVAGTAAGFDDTFTFYSFSAPLPVSTSISSFTVTITGTGGAVQTYNNNGAGFPISDSVIAQTPQSCFSGGTLTVMAAVRTTVTTPVTLSVTQKVAPSGGSPVPSPLPSLANANVTMTAGATIGSYRIYTASYALASAAGAKYGVSSGSFADTFKDVSDLGATCATLGATAPSSTSTTASSSSTSAAPTLGIKPTVGAYRFLGCYTEGENIRALSGAAFANFTSMTLELCASNCAGFNYFGVEYYGECYCGNTINTGSVLAPVQQDCNFICPGDSFEYCGGSNRLEMYGLSSLPTTTISSSTRSTSSTTRPPSGTGSSTSTRSSTSSAAPTGTLAHKQTVGGYTFQGCYTEATNARALDGASTFAYTTMTLEACAASCVSFEYFGVEYGGECYCGNILNAGSVIAPLADCSMICPGDPFEYCGAGNRLELYRRTSASSSSRSSSSTVPSSSRSTSSTRLSTTSSRSSTTSSSRVSTTSTSRSSTTSRSTTSTSRSSTTSRSTSSSRVSTTTSRSSTSSTRSTSSSRSSTTSLSTTSTRSTTSSSTSRTSTSATATGPYIRPTIGAYNYLGCQTEATNARALTGAAFFNGTSMTLESCAEKCASFALFGVEYFSECYCGNSFSEGSVPAPDSDCSFLCPGDQTEYCGAGNRLSTYVKR